MVIQPDPMIAIFGIAGENNNNLSRTKLKLTECVTLLARKSLHPPSWTQRLTEAMQHLKLEEIHNTWLLQYIWENLETIYQLHKS